MFIVTVTVTGGPLDKRRGPFSSETPQVLQTLFRAVNTVLEEKKKMELVVPGH